jgi:hypothetical protein
MMVLQARALRTELDGFEIGRTLTATAWMLGASLLFAGAAYATWWMLDDVLGRSLLAQVVSVGLALTAGTLLYAGAVLLARVHEAEWLMDLLTRRLRRAA